METVLKITLFAFLAICLSGCSADGETAKESSLTGTWQLAQVYTNSGAGPGSWVGVEDGYVYTFSGNGEFASTRFEECSYGTFSSESGLLILNYGCDGFATGMEDPQGKLVEEFTLESGFLLLKPAYLACIEGCGYKFRKIGE